MFDINAIINNAIIAAVEAHITAIQQQHANIVGELAQRIATLEARLTDLSPEVDMDALRALVTPLVGSMVEAKIEEAIDAHQEEYNHDGYDEAVEQLDGVDFDDFVRGDELDSNVRDAVRDLTFEVSVS